MKALLLLSLLALPLSAAVPTVQIYGNVEDVGGQPIDPRVTKLTFKPLSTPGASLDGTYTYLSYTKVTNIYAGGWFTNSLVGGFYDVLFTSSSKITILVPTNGGPYTFTYCAQLATNTPVFSYPAVLGLISTYLTAGANITFVTNNAGVVLQENITISGRTQFPLSAITNYSTAAGYLTVAGGFSTFTNGIRQIPTPFYNQTNIISLAYFDLGGLQTNFMRVAANGNTNDVSFRVASSWTADTNGFWWSITKP